MSARAENCTNQTVDVRVYAHLRLLDSEWGRTWTSTAFTNALVLFQEYYNLKIDSKINNETLRLISSPRCGVHDDLSTFTTSAHKWKSKNLKWHYALASSKVLRLTQAAFEMWQKHTDLSFEHNIGNPDIIISNKRGIYKFPMQK